MNNLHDIKKKLLRNYANLTYSPESIWEKDWDLLILVDACRKDLMDVVAPEYEYIYSINEYTSPGSCTPEWLKDSFGQEYESNLSETAYVTGNPNSIRAFPYNYPSKCDCGNNLNPSYSSKYYDGEHICGSCGNMIEGDREVPVQILREVWREKWDNEYGTILPRPITDVAIKTARQQDPENMIIHYMQPHHPFISSPKLDQGFQIVNENKSPEKMSKTIWEKLDDNEVIKDIVWREYKNNLEFVLDEIELLVKNIQYDSAVITTDHGNAIGEYSLYGHFKNLPISCLVDVPWCTIKVEDKNNYQPNINYDDINRTTARVESQLEDLGYRQ